MSMSIDVGWVAYCSQRIGSCTIQRSSKSVIHQTGFIMMIGTPKLNSLNVMLGHGGIVMHNTYLFHVLHHLPKTTFPLLRLIAFPNEITQRVLQQPLTVFKDADGTGDVVW